MTRRDDAPLGAPCWVDLMTSDTERSRAFYGELLGWEAEDPNPDFGGYFNFTRDGVRVAGCMASQPDTGVPDVWSIYLASDDAEATVAKAESTGAGVIVPAMPVGEMGTMAVITDPGDAAVGVWRPGTHRGFGLIRESGAPGWFELQTRNYEASVDFYREVFGWKTDAPDDDPGFRYTVLTADGEVLAGIMDASNFLPEGLPARWSVYFGVDDTDAALATTERLGGSVIDPAVETPHGRIASATDPTGALFKLMGPSLSA